MSELVRQFFKGFSLKGVSVEADITTPWNEEVTLSVHNGTRKKKQEHFAPSKKQHNKQHKGSK